MDIESLRQYCLSKKAVTEDLPFGDTTLVFRIGGKIFALMSLDTEGCQVNLKCAPERAVELREQFPDDILPGYHMNKKHWNTVHCDRSLDDSKVRELVGHSYDLVRASLPKTLREELENL